MARTNKRAIDLFAVHMDFLNMIVLDSNDNNTYVPKIGGHGEVDGNANVDQTSVC